MAFGRLGSGKTMADGWKFDTIRLPGEAKSNTQKSAVEAKSESWSLIKKRSQSTSFDPSDLVSWLPFQ